jgi:ATP-dependent Clp protease ATP-binding subunit ClpX
MLDVMYDIPANEKVCKVIVTMDSVTGRGTPKVIEGPRKAPVTSSATATAAVAPKKTVESA